MEKNQRSKINTLISQIDVRGGARVEEPDGAASAAAHRGGGEWEIKD